MAAATADIAVVRSSVPISIRSVRTVAVSYHAFPRQPFRPFSAAASLCSSSARTTSGAAACSISATSCAKSSTTSCAKSSTTVAATSAASVPASASASASFGTLSAASIAVLPPPSFPAIEPPPLVPLPPADPDFPGIPSSPVVPYDPPPTAFPPPLLEFPPSYPFPPQVPVIGTPPSSDDHPTVPPPPLVPVGSSPPEEFPPLPMFPPQFPTYGPPTLFLQPPLLPIGDDLPTPPTGIEQPPIPFPPPLVPLSESPPMLFPPEPHVRLFTFVKKIPAAFPLFAFAKKIPVPLPLCLRGRGPLPPTPLRALSKAAPSLSTISDKGAAPPLSSIISGRGSVPSLSSSPINRGTPSLSTISDKGTAPPPSSTINGRGSVPSLSSSPISRGTPLSKHHLPPSLSSSTINGRGAMPSPSSTISIRGTSTLFEPYQQPFFEAHQQSKSSYYDSMYLEIKTNQGVITLLKTGCVLAAKIFSAINLEIKKINDEKKVALAAQFAAEATLRRVYAAQKDDDTPPIEAILAPLEAELKLALQELPYGHSDTDLCNACFKLVPLKIFHPFWKAKANFYLGRLDQAFELLKKLEQGKSIVDKFLSLLHHLIPQFFVVVANGKEEEVLIAIATTKQRVFWYETQMATTRNFIPKHKIGEGGFDPVYKIHAHTCVADNNDYMTPEYIMHGVLSIKVDVFRFDCSSSSSSQAVRTPPSPPSPTQREQEREGTRVNLRFLSCLLGENAFSEGQLIRVRECFEGNSPDTTVALTSIPRASEASSEGGGSGKPRLANNSFSLAHS
ncbi:hypothetical protein ZIOFF_016447 [Zingiber officinale]|uniref:Uncharacterized protein n=1 Tax=Zingiber officinale TaxID=94328 RepID=A0A8J5I2P1_ZINOF|nr:hypothetical protein ZIOFF_016447 [Zingiber officinale]